MSNDSLRMKSPKRKTPFFVLVLTILLFKAVKFGLKDFISLNEMISDVFPFVFLFVFLLIVIIFIFSKKDEGDIYKIETHLDMARRVLVGVFGVVLVLSTGGHDAFLVRFEIGWVFSLFFGLFLFLSAFRKWKSFSLIAVSEGYIKIKDYKLLLDRNIEQIQLFENKMLLINNEKECYVFNDLVFEKGDEKKLGQWIQKHLPASEIQLSWNEQAVHVDGE